MKFTPRSILMFGLTCLSLLLASCNACTEQYDPSYTKELLQKERETAAVGTPKLTDTGELPQAGGQAVSIDERYATLCASCHGANGDGNGPAGAALDPKPRSFVDAAWQDSTSDEKIATVIKSGGAAVGLSPLMAPWGSVLSDDEIKSMVEKVRSFKP